MTPTQAPSVLESHLSSALGPELCHSCTCLQPWPLPALACWLDLRHDLPLPICMLMVGLLVEPAPKQLCRPSCTDRLGRCPWWLSCHPFLGCGLFMPCPSLLRNSSLETLDFPIEIRIAAYLEVTDEGKVCQLSESYWILTDLAACIFILLLLHEQWCYDAQSFIRE